MTRNEEDDDIPLLIAQLRHRCHSVPAPLSPPPGDGRMAAPASADAEEEDRWLHHHDAYLVALLTTAPNAATAVAWLRADDDIDRWPPMADAIREWNTYCDWVCRDIEAEHNHEHPPGAAGDGTDPDRNNQPPDHKHGNIFGCCRRCHSKRIMVTTKQLRPVFLPSLRLGTRVGPVFFSCVPHPTTPPPGGEEMLTAGARMRV